MAYRILADAVVAIHFAFVLFVAAGVFLVLKWPRLSWIHLPSVLWAAVIEFSGWICPLTPLEIFFREKGGAAGYTGGFIDHYIVPIIYPAHLTRSMQIALGIAVVTVNTAVYLWIIYRRRRRLSSSCEGAPPILRL